MAGSLEVAAYLRVAAYAIAFFDYLQTLPAEYRLYARQKGPFNLSTACILFIIVRYVGLATLIVSNTGFFYHGFSPAACDRYFWMAPVLKLILYMTSQIILGLRTYAVSRKSRPVLYILIILFIVCCVPEFLSTFWKRVRSQTHGSCNSGNPPGIHIAALYYVGGLLFDAVTMIITSWYLWKFSSSSRSSFSQLTRMMLRDGLMYFIALSAMNVVNIIFFQNPQTVVQSSAVSLGYTSTMIFSGRFILNLSEHVRDGFSGDQDHSSRTPRTPITPGFRTRGETMNGSEPPLVVSVMKNVITMDDMGKEDGEPRSASKNASQWAMA
ncbi:hypothetical protein DFH08DRAFT_902506 [Mycena albidolilacea]|uniref:DUF6533 domain-containing protein n=1 Tax=Mycena albidolilacea TaxID=1033008 RepID=A0AAD7E9Q6_9AGAR|nr:hypothetical protein DFH08DRAFT_902506 [Mycena albidolilacea]